MADKRAYFKIDVGYFDNPKIANLVDDNPRAVILHLRAIAYCSQHLTDGTFPTGIVMRMVGASQADLEVLERLNLVSQCENSSGACGAACHPTNGKRSPGRNHDPAVSDRPPRFKGSGNNSTPATMAYHLTR